MSRDRNTTPSWLAIVVGFALTLSLAPAQSAQATQAQAEVSVEQGWGFATVSWEAVEAATEYLIVRTPLDGDLPAGPPELVGRWLPERHVDPDGNPTGDLTFADSGFVLGERYRWHVVAMAGPLPLSLSDPVDGDTQQPVGPEDYLTGFELSGGAQWTAHEDEVEVVEAIAAASDRVRLETIGETYEGRPLHLATVGHPAPKDPEEIAESPSVLITCTVHGPERSGREACLMLLRQLAFSDDEWVLRILDRATVLINPTANPDGQNAGRRTNSAGQDLNRDHLLLRHPEAVALSEVVRDHRPDIVVDAHEMGSGADQAPMWPRSLTVHEGLWALSQDDLTLGWHFGASHRDGWWLSPYAGWATNNWEGWLHNTAGLKNSVGHLLETPTSAQLTTRPDELFGSPQNMQRRVYTQLWSFHTILDYHHEHLPAIQDAIVASEAAQAANDGPIYIDGAYEPRFDPPRSEPNTVVLDPPPCGYRLSEEQYSARDGGTLIGERSGDEWESGTVEERLAAHGLEVEEVGAGIVQVLLAQRLRAVIPYLFDPDLDTEVRTQGTPNLGMVDDAVRLADRRATVVVGEVDSGVPNRVDDASCSINDRIADEQAWASHDLFVQHVDTVVDELVAAGAITSAEGETIISAAAQSDIGR